MIAILADEHIPRSLLRALEGRVARTDLVRAQDVGLMSAEDSVLLEWAAEDGRVVLTEDKRTLVPEAHDRVASGRPMPGVLVVRPGADPSSVLEDLVLILVCGVSDDLLNQVVYVPLV